MGNSRSKSFDLTTNDPQIVIEIKVRYYKPSLANDHRQGYWVNITPVKVEGVWRTVTAFSGIMRFVMGAKRFSQKQLDALYNDVRFTVLAGHVEDVWVKEALRVAEDNNLHITHWGNLLKESNRPDFKSIVDAYPMVKDGS